MILENPLIQELVRGKNTESRLLDSEYRASIRASITNWNSTPPLHVREGYGDPWMDWFAWYPVKTTDTKQWRFFSTIQVRYFHTAGWFCSIGPGWWEFRDIPKDTA